jgi:hypothetical protein
MTERLSASLKSYLGKIEAMIGRMKAPEETRPRSGSQLSRSPQEEMIRREVKSRWKSESDEESDEEVAQPAPPIQPTQAPASTAPVPIAQPNAAQHSTARPASPRVMSAPRVVSEPLLIDKKAEDSPRRQREAGSPSTISSDSHVDVAASEPAKPAKPAIVLPACITAPAKPHVKMTPEGFELKQIGVSSLAQRRASKRHDLMNCKEQGPKVVTVAPSLRELEAKTDKLVLDFGYY